MNNGALPFLAVHLHKSFRLRITARGMGDLSHRTYGHVPDAPQAKRRSTPKEDEPGV